MAEELGLEELRAHALVTVGTAKHYLGDETGTEDLELALKIALAANSSIAANALNNLGVLASANDLRRERELFQECFDVAERMGDRDTMRFAEGNLAWSEWACGDWDAALARADAFIALCEAGSASLPRAPCARDARDDPARKRRSGCRARRVRASPRPWSTGGEHAGVPACRRYFRPCLRLTGANRGGTRTRPGVRRHGTRGSERQADGGGGVLAGFAADVGLVSETRSLVDATAPSRFRDAALAELTTNWCPSCPTCLPPSASGPWRRKRDSTQPEILSPPEIAPRARWSSRKHLRSISHARRGRGPRPRRGRPVQGPDGGAASGRSSRSSSATSSASRRARESLDPEDVAALLRPYHARVRDELERHGGTVEKFIGDAVMALFGAPSPTRTTRAGRARRACDPRVRRARRARAPRRDHHRRGARPARREPGRRRGHGLRRRRQHGSATAERSACQRRDRRREDVSRHKTSRRLPGGRAGGGEGESGADRGLGGDRGSRAARASTSTTSRAISSAANASSTALRAASIAHAKRLTPARDARRRSRDRQEPPAIRALARGRRRARAHDVAPGSLPRLRRRHHVLGARGDRQGTGRHRRGGR